MLIDLNTKKYPVDPAEITSKYRDTLFPQDLSRVDWSTYGYAWVYYTKQPDYNEATEAVQEVSPTPSINNTYIQTWQVYALTPEEIARKEQLRLDKLSASARNQRDRLLYQSDWTQLADVGLSEVQKQAWVLYRQALRDISNQQGFPENIIWPNQPQ